MHLEILVEDASGKEALDVLVPKIIGPYHTSTVRAYKGLGRVPPGLRATSDPSRRILLDQLPRLLRGYGRSFEHCPPEAPAGVVVVCDLDRKCLHEFRRELLDTLSACNPAPTTKFCIAVEEAESWFLGDFDAIRAAYPNAKQAVLDTYENDAICDTWEFLADAIFAGGSVELKRQPYSAIGKTKCDWARSIAPHMNVEQNDSDSFRYFRDSLRRLIGMMA